VPCEIFDTVLPLPIRIIRRRTQDVHTTLHCTSVVRIDILDANHYRTPHPDPATSLDQHYRPIPDIQLRPMISDPNPQRKSETVTQSRDRLPDIRVR